MFLSFIWQMNSDKNSMILADLPKKAWLVIIILSLHKLWKIWYVSEPRTLIFFYYYVHTLPDKQFFILKNTQAISPHLILPGFLSHMLCFFLLFYIKMKLAKKKQNYVKKNPAKTVRNIKARGGGPVNIRNVLIFLFWKSLSHRQVKKQTKEEVPEWKFRVSNLMKSVSMKLLILPPSFHLTS